MTDYNAMFGEFWSEQDRAVATLSKWHTCFENDNIKHVDILVSTESGYYNLYDIVVHTAKAVYGYTTMCLSCDPLWKHVGQDRACVFIYTGIDEDGVEYFKNMGISTRYPYISGSESHIYLRNEKGKFAFFKTLKKARLDKKISIYWDGYIFGFNPEILDHTKVQFGMNFEYRYSCHDLITNRFGKHDMFRATTERQIVDDLPLSEKQKERLWDNAYKKSHVFYHNPRGHWEFIKNKFPNAKIIWGDAYDHVGSIPR